MKPLVLDLSRILSGTYRRENGPVSHDPIGDERAAAHLGGGQARIDAQHERGKLTARERIERLLDADSFQEIGAYLRHRHTGFGLEEQRYAGDGVVTGFGLIDRRRVAVFAQDFTIMGGSFSETHALKVGRLLELATGAGLPIVALLDSVGARIQEGVWSLAGFGDLFWRNTQASGVVPQISVMLGPCAGGAVYSPGLTDFVVMVREHSYMFITGPDVIRTVTGEEVDRETLGGADVHAALSGVAHFVADRRRRGPRSGATAAQLSAVEQCGGSARAPVQRRRRPGRGRARAPDPRRVGRRV